MYIDLTLTAYISGGSNLVTSGQGVRNGSEKKKETQLRGAASGGGW